MCIGNDCYRYYYKMGHLLKNGKYVWGKPNHFTSPPFPGQESMQRIVMFGDLGVVKSINLSSIIHSKVHMQD